MGAAFDAVGDVMSRLSDRRFADKQIQGGAKTRFRMRIAEIVVQEFGDDPRGARRAAKADLFNHLTLFIVGVVTMMLAMAASGGA
jgi:hypothetical protein